MCKKLDDRLCDNIQIHDHFHNKLVKTICLSVQFDNVSLTIQILTTTANDDIRNTRSSVINSTISRTTIVKCHNYFFLKIRYAPTKSAKTMKMLVI